MNKFLFQLHSCVANPTLQAQNGGAKEGLGFFYLTSSAAARTTVRPNFTLKSQAPVGVAEEELQNDRIRPWLPLPSSENWMLSTSRVWVDGTILNFRVVNEEI